VTGPEASSAAAFLSELQKALSEEVLIAKTREGFEVAYETTPLIWTDDAYAPGEAATPRHTRVHRRRAYGLSNSSGPRPHKVGRHCYPGCSGVRQDSLFVEPMPSSMLPSS
jgi:hypothetical protein